MQLQFTPKQMVVFLVLVETSTALLIGVLLGMNKGWLYGLGVGAAILAFPFVLIPLILYPLSFVFGWRDLVARYPVQPRLQECQNGEYMICIALRRRWTQYNNCAMWASDDDHLHLWMAWLFRAGHAPFSIPWGQVLKIEPVALHFAMIDLGWTKIWVPQDVVEREMRIREALAEQEQQAAPV